MDHFTFIIALFTGIVNVLNSAVIGSYSIVEWFVLVIGLRLVVGALIGFFKKRG